MLHVPFVTFNEEQATTYSLESSYDDAGMNNG